MPRKKVKKSKRKIIKSDLLPESREFLMEKELEEKKNKKRKKILVLDQKEKPPITGRGEEDSHKRLAMWSGVLFFMILIFALWAFNIKAMFKQTAPKSGNEISWDKITEDFSKTMGRIKENFSEIKSSLNTATSTSSEINKEEIVELKNKLEAMQENIGTSTEGVATSSIRNE